MVYSALSQELGRATNIARVVVGMPLDPDPIPPLMDATLTEMAVTGFVPSGIEYIDGCAYAQFWWCCEGSGYVSVEVLRVGRERSWSINRRGRALQPVLEEWKQGLKALLDHITTVESLYTGELTRLRGIEVVTLTDANELDEGILTNRRKGSRDNIVRWTPRLRAVWDRAKAIHAKVWERRRTAIPNAPSKRFIIVASHGGPLRKTSLDTAWQRFITLAIMDGVIEPEERFALHDLKRRGITDTTGTRADKQEASGHRDSKMMDVYDLSLPVVSPSAD